jgi:cell division protein FtsL
MRDIALVRVEERNMAQPQKRKMSRNEKIFYVISLIVVVSMVVGTIAVAVTPSGF